MADFFQSYGIADLALGKPGIVGLPISCAIGDALQLLKELNLSEVSLWDCRVEAPVRGGGNRKALPECRDCECVGKVSFVDIVCYFARADKVDDIEGASKEPVAVLLPGSRPQIRHLSFNSRLYEAFNLVLDHGTQSFYVPLDKRRNKYVKASSRKPSDKFTRVEYCWVTQEDILRFLLSCIGVFSPMPLLSIKDLGIINQEILVVDLNSKASEALPLLLQASKSMTAVAVVEQGEKFISDISPAGLIRSCDERTLALALAKLSVSDLLSCIHGDSHALKEVMSSLTRTLSLNCEELKAKDSASSLPGLIDSPSEVSEMSDMWDSSTEENSSLASVDSLESLSSVEFLSRSGSGSLSPLTCRPCSSLIAVMAQALAHRSSYVWVTDNDNTLIGMVTYVDMTSALLNHVL